MKKRKRKWWIKNEREREREKEQYNIKSISFTKWHTFTSSSILIIFLILAKGNSGLFQ